MTVFIEKVEIKHFRCFDGGVKQPKVELAGLKDINIVSGANDSGKSNVLRALNLFFNNEISPGIPFDLTRDLCKLQKQRSDRRVQDKRKNGVKDVRQRDLWVKIKVHFYNSKAGILPEHFYVEKVWDGSKNGERCASNHQVEGLTSRQKSAAEGQLTQFLKQFKFEYVPAIKDRQYFRYLFGKLQEALFEKDSSAKFKQHSQNFNDLLLKETSKLFEDFKKDTDIDAKFDIPSTLFDFVRTLSVTTEDNISLFERGDGIQARFIPEILNEIYRGQKKKKIIWGFEEPENSYEDKNLRKLRNDFLNIYSTTKQIFLTTHSFNILSLTTDNISKYRVWKPNQFGTSLINRIDDFNGRLKLEKTEKEKLEEELGIFELTSELDELYRKKEKEFEFIKKQKEIVQTKINALAKPLLFSEDKYIQTYKIAWLKLNDIESCKENFEKQFDKFAPFCIYPAEGATNLAGLLRCKNIDYYNDKKVVGLFDFDTEGVNQFNMCKNESFWKNCPIEGDICNGIYKKRKQHPCFVAMLLPVPNEFKSYHGLDLTCNFVAQEHLLPKTFLKANKFIEDQILPIPGKPVVYRAKETKKSEIWEKTFELKKEDFANFNVLFETLNKIWNSSKDQLKSA